MNKLQGKFFIFIGLLLVFCVFFYLLQNKTISKTQKDQLIQNDQQKIKLDEQKVQEFYASIKEEKIFSQNKEDGVILSLLKILNLNLRNGTYVEFGTGDSSECNTRNLREKYNWKGLLMDGYHPSDLTINRHNEKISYSNILQLFEKHKVDINVDLFSEDTDYADYWIVAEVLTKFKPKIIIHEINQQPPELCVTVPKPKPDEIKYWDGSNYHGGSVCAFHCLAKMNGYTMVYCETKGVNCFLVRNDLLKSNLGVDISVIQNYLTPKKMYYDAKLGYPPTNLEWNYVKC